MTLEQCRSLAVALQCAVPRIRDACSAWCDVRRADEAALLHAAIAEIELCLGHTFGGGNCCSYIGLLNPGARTLTYIAASSQSSMRGCSLRPGEGMAFKCIAKSETLVVGSADEARDRGLKMFGDPKQLFPYICAPLRAEVGLPLGILAVDGLCSSARPLDAGVVMTTVGLDDPKRMVEPVNFCDRLAPFLARNDDACKRIKFWKLPYGHNKNTKGQTNLVAASVICGRVCSIERSRGAGLIYSIRWEDGNCDTELSLRGIKELLQATPASLGIGLPCDAALRGFVDYAGKVIGDHLFR